MRTIISAVGAAALALGLGSAAHAKALVFCSEAAPEGFDPAPYATAATFDASSQVLYNRLVEFERGTANVVPGLAESWDVSDDGLIYTFRLRAGVKFHTTAYFTPTRDLNADDVVFSLSRQQDPKNPFYDYAGGQWPYFSAVGADTLIKSVRKVDEATVAIALIRPDASFPSTLAMDFASILSKQYADALLKAKTRELLNEKPVGTGPYRFIAYDAGVKIGFAANPDYWRGSQKLDLLMFAIVPDPAARLARLKAGQCQAMAAADPAALKAAAGDANLNIVEADRLDVAYLAFNVTKPPFDDLRVRKALGMAIDKAAIVDAVYGGAASVANTIVPPSMWAYDGAAADGGYDVEAAKRLLAEAGVSKLKVKLLTTNAARPYDPDPPRVARMIAADFAKVGVEAMVETAEVLGDFLRQSTDKNRDSTVLIGWTSDDGDPGNFLETLLSCEAVGMSNRAQWCNVEFQALIEQARVASAAEIRTAAYRDAQKLLGALEPLTPIAHSVVSVPMSKRVTGFVADPLGRNNFDGVDIADD